MQSITNLEDEDSDLVFIIAKYFDDGVQNCEDDWVGD